MQVFIFLTMFLAMAAIAPAATTPAANRIYVRSRDLSSEEGLRDLYDRWYAQYRAPDDPFGEKAKRFANFKKEARIVYELNEGGARLKYHLNWFSDLSQEEFSETFANCASFGKQESSGSGERLNRHQPSQHYPDKLPRTVDWRSVDGVLTSVKSQGHCGSCWAFAAAGAMESVHFLENKQRTNISVQELVDCSTSNFGCKGGWASKAFQYVIDDDGITSWEQDPYIGQTWHCTLPLPRPVMAIKSYYYVEPRDEKMLMDAVAQNPVVVLIVGANTTEFKHYAGGVYSGPCDTKAKHQALLVGYGTTPNDDAKEPGVNYWILKFSWGEWWGEKGYMRLQRGYEADGGICGIMLDPLYPANAYPK